jgi:hypothetical protein
VRGRYNPNFVGLFPGDAPQYVILVKLTAPQSSIFAAETAAPVTKVILQAALAARDAALDRGKLASSIVPSRKAPVRAEDVQQTGAPASRGVASTSATESATAEALRNDSSRGDSVRAESFAPYVVTLPLRQQPARARPIHPIPDVRGLDLRDAVRSLHNAGFRVQLGHGTGGREVAAGNLAAAGSAATSPAAGELVPTGTLVRLLFDY